MHVTYENTSTAIPRTLDRVSLGNLLGREVGLKFKPLMGNIQAMNLRKLDLNLLLVFDAIYAEASITRAANRLGLTQPALSNALKRLREHLGDPLFKREGRGIVPTVEAKRLAPAIREALRAIEQAVSIATDFDPPTSARIFSMTLPEALEARLMPPLLNRVTELAPNIQFRLKLFGGNVEQLVLSKEIDFAIFVHPLNKTGMPVAAARSPAMAKGLAMSSIRAGTQAIQPGFRAANRSASLPESAVPRAPAPPMAAAR